MSISVRVKTAGNGDGERVEDLPLMVIRELPVCMLGIALACRRK